MSNPLSVLLNHLLDSLTPAQCDAVRHVEGPLLVLAGPGSGKTRVVTHRVAYLLSEGIRAREILALTFTNKAADEMKARLAQLVPSESVWMSTFHRFCARLLRQYAPIVGIKENYTIYDTDDSHRTLRRVLAQQQIDRSTAAPESVAAAISWAKNHLIRPEEYQGRLGHPLGVIVEQAYPAYQELLARCNAVDFDDLLLHTATLLRDNPEIRRQLDDRYRFILVDEYQDTNLAQYAIVRALSIDHPNLAVTGDPDQSIYGWRGANLRNILDFDRDFPNVRVVRLERNYRSTKRILEVAAELISHNLRRKPKDLYTENDEGPAVRLVRYETHRDEAADVADQIAEAIRVGRRRARDFAVFYRVNALSVTFERALRERNIPFQMVHGLEFFARKEIKDVVAYLQLIANPANDMALLRVINTPARGIGKTTLERLADHARSRGATLLEAARDAGAIGSLSRRAAKLVGEFVALFDRIAPLADAPIEELLGHVLAESGCRAQWEQSDMEEDQQRLANIDELLTVGREFDERYAGDGAPLEAFLEETALVNDTDDWETEIDRVTLMTLHASKGLEFPVVYLVAAEEGLLPHERSRERPDQLEEERRLMFVGITRAEQELQISLARDRDYRGRRGMTVPSSFLMELPRDRMEILGFDETVPLLLGEWDECRREPAFAPPRMAGGLGLTTAAELAGQGTPKSVSPDAFHQDMLVRHPKYGLGRIVALSGSGDDRKATVDFTSSAVGRKKFVLKSSPLRPLKR
ncbi:MAG: UvrD-helicase domain-containing protein [Pirellulales bacterium]|nr:UvrD-helicase domain-containing protein [Pirellulales bacterium]